MIFPEGKYQTTNIFTCFDTSSAKRIVLKRKFRFVIQFSRIKFLRRFTGGRISYHLLPYRSTGKC
ncbi:hypothetical protein, partial [Paenibacillus macerans]|uniref:hypothetical protein n=1 Tax=Paenibacillus macerans TaxID=44252 RepID=UPI001D131676